MRTDLIGLAACLVFSASLWTGPRPASARPLPQDRQRAELGLALDDAKGKEALVKSVQAGGPAELAGIAPGDALLRVAGVEVTGFQHFHYLLHFHLEAQAGGPVEVVFRRGQEQRTVTVASLRAPILPAIMAAGARQTFRADAEIFPDLTPDYLERALLRLFEQHKLAKAHDGLRRVLKDDVHRKGGFFRLDRVTYAERNPLRAHRVGEQLVADVRGAASRGFQPLPELAWRWLDVEGAAQAPTVSLPADPATVLPAIERIFAGAEAHRARAFADLTAEEVAFLGAAGAGLVADFTVSAYIHWRGQKHLDQNLRAIRLARKVRFPELARMAAALAPLWQTGPIAALGQGFEGATPLRPDELPEDFGVEGAVLAFRKTPHGVFVVGGPGPNVYRAPFALIIDVGGDDVYEHDAGTGWLNDRPGLGCVIDVAGDDRYAGGQRMIGQGCGWLGAGLLIDLAGDDTYELARLGQGAGYFGFGLLLDGAGKDRYRAGELCQGAGLFGVGALVDLGDGADVYEAKLLAQGLGSPKGLGLLFDEAGDDAYSVGGTYRSSYGTEGIYRGFGQGMATGFRHNACGGIGVLLDQRGDDRYEAGNFSQGGGYYMAMGVLADDEGSDQYQVTRYGQGFGCHSAVGVLLEGGGADVYRGRIAANQGAAWDAGVGVLIERGGDDRYEAPGLSLGAASMNGFGLLYEAGGVDVYATKKRGLGFANKNDYWWGRGGAGSLGILLELGAGADDFGKSGRTAGAVDAGGAFGLFVDQAGDLLDFLAGDPDVERLLEEKRREVERRKQEAEQARRNAEAQRGYEAAEARFARGELEQAIAAFREVAKEHPDVAWGVRAATRAEALASDPTVLEAIANEHARRDCTSWLGLAQSYLDNGHPDLAARYLRRVIDTYPKSSYAKEARTLLAPLEPKKFEPKK